MVKTSEILITPIPFSSRWSSHASHQDRSDPGKLCAAAQHYAADAIGCEVCYLVIGRTTGKSARHDAHSVEALTSLRNLSPTSQPAYVIIRRLHHSAAMGRTPPMSQRSPLLSVVTQAQVRACR